MSKSNLYDTSFDLYQLTSGTTDLNGDATVTKTFEDTYACQIDNLNGADRVAYGKNNEVSTHVIFCDLITQTYIDTSYEIICQNMMLDISFIARNEGGLTNLTKGIEIYCIFREFVKTP